MLTWGGWWSKASSQTASDAERLEARKFLCELYKKRSKEWLGEAKASDKHSSESPPGTRKRKGVRDAASSSSRWLERRPTPDSESNPVSASKRRPT